jgi:hypothetical protein
MLIPYWKGKIGAMSIPELKMLPMALLAKYSVDYWP